MSAFKLRVVVAIGVALMAGHFAPSQAHAASPAFARGVNILGYDPYWDDPAKARFHWRHLTAIKGAGFDHVRVNLFAFAHMDNANRLDPAWLARLDMVVRETTRRGLGVILDEHDYNACSDDVALCRIRLLAFWRQVAPRYRRAPKDVAFELLNEPHGALDSEKWNALFATLLKTVRASNPTRTVIVGPTHWNGLADLPLLKLPSGDRNLLVTFHYYEPFDFTHQGAPWMDQRDTTGVTWGTPADRARLRKDFATVAAWSRANRRPILLGEFGAYDRSGTPIALRAIYTDAVAREAERSGFGWAYWQFDSDFVVWDMTKDNWVAPIRDALIKPR
jgi:endoglucanase